MNNPIFTQVVTSLLKAEVICAVKDRVAFDYLRVESNKSEVQTYLKALGRDVRSTSTQDAFICCYTNINDPQVKASSQEQFKIAAKEFQPLVEWLCLVMDCNPTGTPIRAGDIIAKGEILERIEQSQVLYSRLAHLAGNRVFGSRSQDAVGQLQQILAKLVEWGYFISFGHAGTRYQATGRWSVLYDQLGFIRTYEALDEDFENEATQDSLI